MTDFLNTKALDQSQNAPNADQQEGKGGDGVSQDQNPDQGTVIEVAGRKFTREELEKSFVHKEAFIEQLKQERAEDRKRMEELEAAVKKGLTAEDLLNQLKPKENDVEPGVKPAVEDQTPQAKPEDVAKLVFEQIEARDRSRKAESNWESVTSELTKRFGNSVNEKVKEVAKENDFTVEEAVEFAKSRPKAFLKLFPDAKPAPATPSQSRTFNTQAHQAQEAPSSSGFWETRDSRSKVSLYEQALAKRATN